MIELINYINIGYFYSHYCGFNLLYFMSGNTIADYYVKITDYRIYSNVSNKQLITNIINYA